MATVLLQARMGSSRLPGKAMADLGGRPLLSHVIEILKASSGVDRVVLCTTQLEADDPLIELADRHRIDRFRGAVEDVLERFHQAVRLFPDDLYLRATGDNPLIDPKGIERILPPLASGQWDYVCERGMPIGTVVEGISAEALIRSHRLAKQAQDREHVTLFCKQSGLFRCHYPMAPAECQGETLRMTVDTPQDLEWARTLVSQGFGGPGGDFPAMVRYAKESFYGKKG